MDALFTQADELLERLTLEALEKRDDFTARVALSRFHAQRGDYDKQLSVLEALPDGDELVGRALLQAALRAGGAQQKWLAERALARLTGVVARSRALILLDCLDEALSTLIVGGEPAEAILLAAPRGRWSLVRASARRLTGEHVGVLVYAARRYPGRLGALYLGLAARFSRDLLLERSMHLLEREARRLPYGPERALVFARFQMVVAGEALAPVVQEQCAYLASQGSAALRASVRLLETRAPRFAACCPRVMRQFREILAEKLAREEAQAASRDPELAGPVRALIVRMLSTERGQPSVRLETPELDRSLARIRTRYVHLYRMAQPFWKRLERRARLDPLRRLSRFLRRDPWEG